MTSLAAPDTATFGDADDIFARIRGRLHAELPRDALDPAIVPRAGDQTLNAWNVPADFLVQARPAAVLVGIVAREGAAQVLLTRRTADLRDHAGQIAFPGGKMDPTDDDPAATARREAQEEIGLDPGAVEVLGYLDAYLTRTGFRIVPVVARLRPPFDLRPNAAEVAEVFEVPFAYLMDAANHQLRQREWLGALRSFYAIEHETRMIWGITAGILRILYERLYEHV